MKAVLAVLIAAAGAHAATSKEAAELTNRAERLYTESRYAEAEPLYRQAVEAWSSLGPQEKRNRALAMCELGGLLRAVGRDRESESLLNESLRDLESGPDASRALWNLATLYRTRGQLSKAESSAVRAAEMVEGADRVAPRLVLASIYTEQHRYPEAEQILQWAEEGADEALRVAIYNNFAAIALATGKYSRAEEFSRKAIEAGQRSLPARHPAIAAAWNNVGQACRFQGNYLDAERAYRRSIDLWAEGVGASHPNVARAMMNLAALHHERGRETGAEILYRNAGAILEAAYGPEQVHALIARNELADVLRAQRRFTESDKLGSSTLAALERTLPAGDIRLTQALQNRLRLLRGSGRAQEAALIADRLRLAAVSAAPPESGADRAADHKSGALLAR